MVASNIIITVVVEADTAVWELIKEYVHLEKFVEPDAADNEILAFLLNDGMPNEFVACADVVNGTIQLSVPG